MRLIDADALKKAIIKHLCVKSENYLLPAEKSIYNLIDEQPTIEQPKDVRCKDCISRVPAKDPDCCVCRNPVSPCYQREVRDSDLCQFAEGR